jgi:hypothetical protein
MAFLLASSLSLVRDSEEMCIVPDNNRYVEVGETVTLHVIADADTPINVIGGTIFVPTDLLSIESLSRENSIIDLWAEEPAIVNDSEVHFSGGVINKTGFLGNGRVLTLVVRPIKEGEASIRFDDTQMLAHDGTGMEVTCNNSPITLSIRPETYPSPDVNGDKQVNIFDFGIVSARLFMNYQRLYDLNLDGRITLSDIGILVTNMTTGTRLGSIAILYTK